MALSKIVLSLDLGGSCRLQVHENNKILIKDMNIKKCAFLIPSRWKRFIGIISDNEEHVQIIGW